MTPPINERIYSESEILQVLKGLAHVYHAKPWWSRWLFKPWLSAIETTMLVLCGDMISDQLEAAQIFEDIDKHLSD